MSAEFFRMSGRKPYEDPILNTPVMEINSLPSEILSSIIGHLIDVEKYNLDEPYLADVCRARLVCRKWDEVARQHVFRDVALVHTSEDFKTWNNMLDSAMIRDVARRADIHSTARWDASYESRRWGEWKEGRCDALASSMARISELPKIDSIMLRFDRECWGVETGHGRLGFAQTVAQRRCFFQAICEAIVHRARGEGVCPIRSLAIENLQNAPIPEVIASDSFKEATKDVEELSLSIIHEKYNYGTLEYDFVERRTFEPFLQNMMLPAFADRLTSLTLYFEDKWGVVPGRFDGQGLVLPHLKRARLGNYLIAHHNQLDWLLSSTLLESLRLDSCHICTHMCFDEEYVHEWKLAMHDWIKHPEGTFGVRPPDIAYTFPGTWAQILDKIRTSQPHLVDFCLHSPWFGEISSATPWLMTNEITEARYLALQRSCDEVVIEMKDYGSNYCSGREEDDLEINPAREHLEDDTRALEELDREIFRRRRLL